MKIFEADRWHLARQRESHIMPPVSEEELARRTRRARSFLRWTDEAITVDRVISVGDQLRAIGTWSNTVQEPDGSTQEFNGHFTSDLILEGNFWKIRLNTYDQSRFY